MHRQSKGVPRLINIFCDRALLGSCVTRSPMVTRRILDKAIAEVQDGHSWRKPSRYRRWAALAVGLLVVAIGAGWGYWEYAGRPDLPPQLASLMGLKPAPEPPSPDEVIKATVDEDQAQIALAKAVADERIGDLLAGGELLTARDTALRLLLQRWSVELGQLSGREACARLSAFGLECELDRGGWSRVRDYNLPALLHLQDKEGRDGWAALVGLGQNEATLELPGGRETLSLAALDGLWTGDFLLVWQPPPVGGTVIRPGSSGEAVRWLRHLLTQVAGLEFKDDGSNKFDLNLEKAVRRFQTQAGLEVDGLAGPRTLIRLATAVDMPGLPKLTSKN